MSAGGFKKLLVVQVAGLGYEFVTRERPADLIGCPIRALEPVFPGLTCTAQATLRTGLPVARHGLPSNGFFDPVVRKPFFWEQSSALVSGARFWAPFRAKGGTVGMTFFQQSLGESVDLSLSPAPIHTHGGGLVEACHSQPSELYARLARFAGRAFRLRQYWGPLASVKSSEWIADAMCGLLSAPDAPDLLMTYLPGLDYDLQRFGPEDPRSSRAWHCVKAELERLAAAARTNGYEVVIFGDYAITPVTQGAFFPNRLLRETGYFATRDVRGRTYPDFHVSKAFALVDHQLAIVHCEDAAVRETVRRLFLGQPQVDEVLDPAQMKVRGLDHPRSGDLLLVASPGAWFAYPWWSDAREAPDYAVHVDIHNKPGFDPCELFFGRHPFHISTDTSRIRGTHGRAGHGCETVLVSTFPLQATTLPELSDQLRDWLIAF